MTTAYQTDVVAWVNEQAALLRTGRFAELDIENIAEEIESVAKSEKRELARRMTELLLCLLKWQHQPGLRCGAWRNGIRARRKGIAYEIKATPSFTFSLEDKDWVAGAYGDARIQAHEQGFDITTFPETCPWLMQDVLTEGWLP